MYVLLGMASFIVFFIVFLLLGDLAVAAVHWFLNRRK